MASPLLDVKKFRHVKSDEHTTTLQHADGHTLTINHKALSKPNQEQLKSLSKMADKSKTEPQKQEDPGDKPGRNADEDRIDRPDTGYGKIIYKAQGGEILAPEEAPPVVPTALSPQAPSMADAVVPKEGFFGTNNPAIPVPQSPTASPDDLFNQRVDGKMQALRQENYSHLSDDELRKKAEQDSMGEMSKEKQGQAEEAKAKEAGIANNQAAATSSYQRELSAVQKENEQRAALGLSPKPLPVDPNAEQAQGLAQNSPMAPEVAAPTQESTPAVASVVDGGAKSPKVGAAAPTAPQAPDPVKPGEEFLAEDKAFQHDMVNGHITPKTYQSMFNNKDTLGKVGTLFGLLLSGIGSGMSRQPNMVMQMMDNEIAKDIEAQKASKSNALDFRKLAQQEVMNSATMKHLGVQDSLVVDQLAQMRAGRYAFHNMMSSVNGMPDGPTKQSALQVLGMISQGLDSKAIGIADQLNAKQAMYQNTMGGTGNENVLMRINQAKSMYGEHVANEALKELPEYEKKQKVMSGVDQAMKEMYDNAAYKNLPYTAKGQQYEAAKAKVKTLTSEIFGGKSEAEFKIIEGFFPGMTTKKETFNKQKDSIMQKLDSQSSFPVLSRLGIAKSTAPVPEAEVKTFNGAKYQKVNGGWKKLP